MSQVKRKVKDSVFTHLFSEPEYLLKLYQTLHPEDRETKAEDITDVTIENILMNGLYNDLGFRVKDNLIVLAEAQSTWSLNIIYRSFLYLAKTYQDYNNNLEVDIFRTPVLELPEPELFVIYSKNRGNRPDLITFKDAFFHGKDIAVDIKIKVLYGENKEDIIGQYVCFCKVVDEELRKSGYSREAINNAIRICQDQNVLYKYLEQRKHEVMDIYDFLYNEEVLSRNHDSEMIREGISIGEKRGISIGEKRGISIGETQMLEKLISKGYITREQAKAMTNA